LRQDRRPAANFVNRNFYRARVPAPPIVRREEESMADKTIRTAEFSEKGSAKYSTFVSRDVTRNPIYHSSRDQFAAKAPPAGGKLS